VGEEGFAHLAEHMTFKGTRRRSARQVVNAVESLGGELNAFTTKEDTTFYAAIGRVHLRQAIDVLTDMVFCSTYPQAELDKEIEVVCDEIESYNDTPAELIYDDFENLVFPNHPLGHNILGQAEQLRSYTHNDVARFTSRHYRPGNAVFFAYGDVDFRRLVSTLEKLVGNAEEGEGPVSKTAHSGKMPGLVAEAGSKVVRRLSTHQAHVMVGTRAYGYGHPQRMALALLTNILGGPGMNSRLNVALRERHGLVYTVEAVQVNYTDTGVWSVYFGCDPADVSRCLRLVYRELGRLTEKPLSAAQLAAAKRQMRGQVMIACDNREQAALDFAKLFLHHNITRDIDDLLRKIDDVGADVLYQTAQELFAPDRLMTLIYQ
jgi:predicted Zn-dependent peptidase